MNRWFNYIKFFWYFASNWNPRLATFMLRHEIKGEKKYQLDTSSPAELAKLTISSGDISKASRYEAVNFFILEALLKRIRELTDHTFFTDLGCGKGRAMVVAAHYGFTNIKGIDFAMEVCESAKKNMGKIKQQFPGIQYTVTCDDVLNYSIHQQESVFFMFNPFNDEILRAFLEKIEHSLEQHPRAIYFLYVSPKYIDVFFEFEYEPVYRKRKLKWLDGVILKRAIENT